MAKAQAGADNGTPFTDSEDCRFCAGEVLSGLVVGGDVVFESGEELVESVAISPARPRS